MRISDKKMRQLASDLGLNISFIKGQEIEVRNCWHFYTNGNEIDAIFYSEEDFRNGMNRIYNVIQNYDVTILAFALMDTHVHFILHGQFDECNRFMHEYIRRTSLHISNVHGEKKKLADIEISHQPINTARYLKTAICYVLKNAPVAGIRFNAYDYPWSSAALLFRNSNYWTAPKWTAIADMHHDVGTYSKVRADDSINGKMFNEFGARSQRTTLRTRKTRSNFPIMLGELVFPGEYVAFEIVEQLFRTHKSFNYFMCISKESDIESQEGIVSHLSIPIQEMRQHKNELCQQIFNRKDIRSLDTEQRIRLAKIMKSNFNSSSKQIARLCGLIYSEVKDMF